MAQQGTQLTEKNTASSAEYDPLARVQSLPYKLCFQRSLDNKYNFKLINQSGLKDLHDFIENTVGKGLSISDVDALYLRKRGLGLSDEIHYGKDKHPFRVHGQYIESHFVVTKIDCAHKVSP